MSFPPSPQTYIGLPLPAHVSGTHVHPIAPEALQPPPLVRDLRNSTLAGSVLDSKRVGIATGSPILPSSGFLVRPLPFPADPQTSTAGLAEGTMILGVRSSFQPHRDCQGPPLGTNARAQMAREL